MAVALGVMILLIHNRRPHEGIREWVRQSRQVHLQNKTPNKKNNRVPLEQIWEKESVSITPVDDFEQLRKAATELVDEIQGEVKKPRKSRSAKRLPPMVTPTQKVGQWMPVEKDQPVIIEENQAQAIRILDLAEKEQ